ncbi:MAG: hypothetical protein AB9903_09845 [Vulcanimicrobiota bacterium]
MEKKFVQVIIVLLIAIIAVEVFYLILSPSQGAGPGGGRSGMQPG